MAENSNIEWTDSTFNPWQGCTKVSPGCDNCYAETLTKRHGKCVWGPHGTRVVTSPSYWNQPYKWNREAERMGVRKRVFCASTADVFESWKGPMEAGWGECKGSNYVKGPNGELHLHGYKCRGCEDWPLATMQDFRNGLFQIIEETPNLDWLLLTKRPQLVLRMAPESWQKGFPSNVWLGTSVENQEEADRRIPHLLACPARVRFLSCEPLLGPVDLTCVEHAIWPYSDTHEWTDALSGHACLDGGDLVEHPMGRLHWIIVGGESGPGKRPMDLAWARSIRDQCKAAGVAFFGKQWDKVRELPEDLLIRQFPQQDTRGVSE